MTNISVLLISIVIIFAVLSITPVVAQEAEVTVTVNAPETVIEGGIFDVTVDVDSITEFNGAQFDVSFDSKMVKVNEVTEGSIDGEEISIDMWGGVESGTIRVMPMVAEDIGVNGSGYLAEITFEVKGKEGDDCVLDIADGFLFNNKGEEILADWIGDAQLSVGIKEEDDDDADDVDEDIDGEEEGEEGPTPTPFLTSKPSAALTSTPRITATATPTSTPTLAPEVTHTPEAMAKLKSKSTPTPTPKPAANPKSTPTPKSAVPGFEAIFAIAMMLVIVSILLRRR
jgi:hypothetical protein